MALIRRLLLFSFLLPACFCEAQNHDLDYFIQIASENSPAIKDFQNQILISRIDSQILKASLKTQVNFLNTNSYAPIINGWGYDPAITNYANLTAVFQANRNFVTATNLAVQLRTIDLQRRALLDTIRLSIRDLKRTITEQYITAYGDLLAVDFTREVFDLMKKEEEMLKKLTEANVFKQTDYLNFYVTMQQQELTNLQVQNQYAADYLTLNYLAGIVDTTVQRLSKPDLQEVLSSDFDSSIFMQKFITDSLRIANEKQLIRNQYRPRVGAYADGGYSSSLQFLPYRNFGFSAGLSLTVPIYDGHQRQLRYAQENIREQTRQNNKHFFLNQYYQQVSQLRQQLRAIDMLTEKINKQIEYSHTLIMANNKLLETGDITMRDYVTAINNYLSAQNLLTLNNIARLRIVNQINYWNQ
ncbi:MAG: TolC family protein [Flavisolibacter sp.]